MPDEELVSATKPIPDMRFVKMKPMPESFWRLTHPVIQAIRRALKRLPRNVLNYRVQELPDGCHNCSHLYCGAPPDLECGLACRTPERPAICDSVNLLGKCDSWEKFVLATIPTADTSQVLGSTEEIQRIQGELATDPSSIPTGRTVIPFTRPA